MASAGTLFRHAVSADAVQAADVMARSIIALCGEDHCGDPTVIAEWTANKTPDFVLALIASDDVVPWVAERSGAIVGVGAYRIEGEIALNYVAPEARGTGVSTGLLAHMEAELATGGHGEVRLTSTATAHDFYLARGYLDIGEPAPWRGSAVFKMRKSLGAVQKVCPVVLRWRASERDILVFRHPLAGVQLIKGTIEPNEPVIAAALRELEEEAGINRARVASLLGESTAIAAGQHWHFLLVDAGELPERWTHRCTDDGGHEFAFFWHRLNAEPEADWHPLFVAALDYVRGTLRQ